MPVIFEAAHLLGLVPLAWLIHLLIRGQAREPYVWGVAVAFAVSFMADLAVDLGAAPMLASLVYPVSQAGIVGAALLPRQRALGLVLALVVVGASAALWQGTTGPDLLLRTVAFGLVVAMAHGQAPRLRFALTVYFGCGLVAWWLYVGMPGWGTWGGYQLCRALGVGGFCWATARDA